MKVFELFSPPDATENSSGIGPEQCKVCNGTGKGHDEGSKCRLCKGTGILQYRPEELNQKGIGALRQNRTVVTTLPKSYSTIEL